jgi:hypothetical protein
MFRERRNPLLLLCTMASMSLNGRAYIKLLNRLESLVPSRKLTHSFNAKCMSTLDLVTRRSNFSVEECLDRLKMRLKQVIL